MQSSSLEVVSLDGDVVKTYCDEYYVLCKDDTYIVYNFCFSSDGERYHYTTRNYQLQGIQIEHKSNN